jgi:hypothetical protein
MSVGDHREVCQPAYLIQCFAIIAMALVNLPEVVVDLIQTIFERILKFHQCARCSIWIWTLSVYAACIPESAKQ